MEPSEETTGVALPARSIPWPGSVSEAARRRLIELNQAGETSFAYPDPGDSEGWRRFIRTTNEAFLAMPGPYGRRDWPGIRCETASLGGVTVHVATPETHPAETGNRVYLEIHGGGLVFLAGEGCRRGALREAARLAVRVVSIDYRVPPDHPYPAALDDCVAAYRALLEDHRPGEIILGGISGGGNLAAAAVLRIRDEGLKLPAALVLLTPEVDLTESGDSFETVMGLDPVLRDRLAPQIAVYAPGRDLTDPYLSPIFADFSRGYPPTFLQSGTRDLFLSNTVRMHRRLRDAGIPAELHVWEAMPHGGFFGTPEDESVSAELRRFLGAHWR
jgi:acetyl esterase/lipase